MGMGKEVMAADYLRKSKLALGVFVICVLFGVETATVHAVRPHPASPIVWTALGLVGGVALVALFWLRAKARRSGE